MVSTYGWRLLSEEADISDASALQAATGDWSRVDLFDPTNRGATPASGSAPSRGMVICPCSMGTLGSIAAGTSRDLVERAADVTLKERRPLILVPRETPLSLIHLENMLRLARAGATILPAAPGFYNRPASVEELVDFVVARILDHLGVENQLALRYLLVELQAIAPVTIVFGNTDGMEVRATVPERAEVELGGATIVVIHGNQYGAPTPRLVAAANPRADLVVFGHSHQPVVERIGETLLVNPGSAGPRRFSQPVTVALADIEEGRVTASIVHLIENKGA
jgi:4-hydroxy-3-polyprenylbenzoate decarboxylase